MEASASHPCFTFSILILALQLAFNVAATTHPQDVNALLVLRQAWSSKPSTWDTSTDPCESHWLGVNCTVVDGSTRVSQLILINQGLNGNLPAAIGDLTSLQVLDLSSNRNLGGQLPPEIGNLTSLWRLFLQSCMFSGTIPREIGNMKNLSFLSFYHNMLTGSIPASIGQLTHMDWFDVARNNLSGNLPDSTGTGGGLDNLTSARHFHLQHNSFSGSIPTTIFTPKMKLIHLLLNHNSFSGTIPSAVGNLAHLEILRLDFNKLTGPIPDTISGLPNLTALQLNNNGLSGQLPDLSSMTKLKLLNLSNNQYEPMEIPSWVSTLKNISAIYLQSASLIGEIPASIFSLRNISNVTLGLNNLNGSLDLRNASPSLVHVDVENNSISSLDKGSYSKDLNLDGNPLCNSQPEECTLSAPSSPPPQPPPYLSDCSCSDPYNAPNPTASGQCVCSRPVICYMEFVACVVPTLGNYFLQIQKTFAGNPNLSKYLNGEDQVVIKYVSKAQATVSIFPPGTRRSWDSVDENQISYILNSERIILSYLGQYICEFHSVPVVIDRKLSKGIRIGIGVGVAAFTIAIFVLGAYATIQKKRADKALQKSKPFASWIAATRGENIDIPQLKGARWFSFAEVQKATNKFSQKNEIGAGGYGKVYRGFLSSGEQVAIKRAHESSLKGAEEFKNEIELLSRVHHRNLVGLIGFCFEQGEQLLVYQYMQNGSMRESLSGRSGQRMDWERRVALALNSARGIAYLHTEANPPIIHRDIKSSNILLDEKLVAKVGDFGVSKIAPDDDGTGEGHVSTKVKGTMGYLDPEYFVTFKLTHKSDVYSFGVVLLELITARQPIERGRYIVREVSLALEQGGMANLQRMLDPSLTDYPREALEKFVSIALRCVEAESASRPTMSEVVKELEALVQKSCALEMEMGVNQDRSELNLEGSPHLQKASRISFESSGVYETATNLEPK